MLALVDTNAGAKAPRAERRNGIRQRLLLRSAKLRCISGEYPCVIHDVSETGAKLRLFHAHPPDSHMFLELANGTLYAIERRWIAGTFAGYRFSSRVDTDEFVHEKDPKGRRPVRLRMAHPARITSAGETSQAMLADLSQQGACIEAGRQIAIGALLRIEIPTDVPRYAHVCWRKDYRHGLAFQEALTLENFARLAFELQPFAAEPATAASLPEQVRATGA